MELCSKCGLEAAGTASGEALCGCEASMLVSQGDGEGWRLCWKPCVCVTEQRSEHKLQGGGEALWQGGPQILELLS